jgi:hypothetical protein
VFGAKSQQASSDRQGRLVNQAATQDAVHRS